MNKLVIDSGFADHLRQGDNLRNFLDGLPNKGAFGAVLDSRMPLSLSSLGIADTEMPSMPKCLLDSRKVDSDEVLVEMWEVPVDLEGPMFCVRLRAVVCVNYVGA